jgi:hypothetical protein
MVRSINQRNESGGKGEGLVACNLFLALSVIESFALLLFCEQEESAAALLGGGVE